MIILPPKEYGEMCHAVRTKCANRIPSFGHILYKDHLYSYMYNDDEYQFIFTEKLLIRGNEERIAKRMRRFRNA